MSTTIAVLLILAGLSFIAGSIYFRHQMQTRQRRALQARFLSEYDRTVEKTGDPRAAEVDLRDRVERHDRAELHDLDVDRRQAMRKLWVATQVGFVDAPQQAVVRAARLVHETL